jgi:hypothetical protein
MADREEGYCVVEEVTSRGEILMNYSKKKGVLVGDRPQAV